MVSTGSLAISCVRMASLAEIKIKMVGLKRYTQRMKNVPKNVKAEGRKVVVQAAMVVAANAQKLMTGSRTRAKRSGGVVTAPKGILGTDTGVGRASIFVTPAKTIGKGEVASEVSARVQYMSIQERIGLYKWLAPAIKKSKAEIARLYAKIPKAV